VVEILDERKTEANQRHSGAQPRHYRAFEGKTGAQPREMAVCRDPYFEPARMRGSGRIYHAKCLFACEFKAADRSK
jgi:hypothetical protein